MCVYICACACVCVSMRVRGSRFARRRNANRRRERARTRRISTSHTNDREARKQLGFCVSSNLREGPVKHALVKDGGL